MNCKYNDRGGPCIHPENTMKECEPHHYYGEFCTTKRPREMDEINKDMDCKWYEKASWFVMYFRNMARGSGWHEI